MTGVTHVHTDELVAVDKYSTPNWPRRLIFETDEHVVLESRASGGTVSGWHHHGERDAYVFHLEGSIVIERADGEKTKTERPGTYSYIPSDAIGVHRYIVPDEVDELVGILMLVGDGPAVVNVEGPDE